MPSEPPPILSELDEDVDLAPDRRKYVLDAYARLADATYYDILDVPRTATKAEIKRAYFRLVGIVHPDRYFDKHLGSFKPKMEAIFARLSAAYEALSKSQTRAEYDASIADHRSSRPPAQPEEQRVRTPADDRQLAERKAAMDALKARFVEAKAKAKTHVDAAVRAKGAGDFVRAAESYKQALALSPNDPALVAAYEEAKRAANAQLADSIVKQAMLEERYGHWAEAAASWKRVVEARPDDTNARERLAAALARAGGAQR
jgi:curved DNA-binding protein CbpA